MNDWHQNPTQFQMDTQSRCHEGTGIVCHSFKQKRQVDAVYSYIYRFGSD